MKNSTITFITDQLKQLTSIPSPTGFTKEARKYHAGTRIAGEWGWKQSVGT